MLFILSENQTCMHANENFSGIISYFIIPCETEHWCIKSHTIVFFRNDRMEKDNRKSWGKQDMFTKICTKIVFLLRGTENFVLQ